MLEPTGTFYVGPPVSLEEPLTIVISYIRYILYVALAAAREQDEQEMNNLMDNPLYQGNPYQLLGFTGGSVCIWNLSKLES